MSEKVELVQYLYSLIREWDKLDIILHKLLELLGELKSDRKLFKRIGEYFDFSELLSSAQHYKAMIESIVRILESMLEGE